MCVCVWHDNSTNKGELTRYYSDDKWLRNIYIYIRSPMGVEHSGKGIFSRRSHNAKLFERIVHSGSR